jgi:hypothetical protein
MSRQFDSVTVALTGQLFFILVASAILALIASYLLLRLYRRAVIKSMRRVGRSEILEPKGYLPPELEHKPHDAPLNFNFIVRRAFKANREAISLYRSAIRRRCLAAFVHMIAGCCFAAVMTATFLLAGKLAFSPFRFLYITWANAWPILIAIDLAVGFRRVKWIGFGIYFLVGGILGSISLAKSPDLKLAELLYFWLDVNAPPTILLLIFLNRRIRAVGPLVLVFMILGVTGATLFVTLIGNNFKLLKVLSDFTYSIGLSATGTVIALHLIGFAAFAIIGWLILGSLRRLYEKKYLSEHSITVDAVWLLFGIANSIGLVFEGRLWILSGIAAFIVYKVVGAGLFHLLRVRRRAKINSPRLLFLRVRSRQAQRKHFRRRRQILARHRQHTDDRWAGSGDRRRRALRVLGFLEPKTRPPLHRLWTHARSAYGSTGSPTGRGWPISRYGIFLSRRHLEADLGATCR